MSNKTVIENVIITSSPALGTVPPHVFGSDQSFTDVSR